MLQGKKTYLLAIAAALYALVGWVLGFTDGQEAIRIVIDSGLFAAIRKGVADSIGGDDDSSLDTSPAVEESPNAD